MSDDANRLAETLKPSSMSSATIPMTGKSSLPIVMMVAWQHHLSSPPALPIIKSLPTECLQLWRVPYRIIANRSQKCCRKDGFRRMQRRFFFVPMPCFTLSPYPMSLNNLMDIWHAVEHTCRTNSKQERQSKHGPSIWNHRLCHTW